MERENKGQMSDFADEEDGKQKRLQDLVEKNYPVSHNMLRTAKERETKIKENVTTTEELEKEQKNDEVSRETKPEKIYPKNQFASPIPIDMDNDHKIHASKLRKRITDLEDQLRAEKNKNSVSGIVTLKSQLSEIKGKNIELMNRILSGKIEKKQYEESCQRKDKQIQSLTIHMEKLMSFLKVEASKKSKALEKKKEYAKQLQNSRKNEYSLVRANRSIRKEAKNIQEQDRILSQVLNNMDSKFQRLHRAQRSDRLQAERVAKAQQKKLASVTDSIWERETKLADSTTARVNTLLGALKVIESLYGQMKETIIDLQECQLGDAGAEAISRTIRSIVARRGRRKHEIMQYHRDKISTASIEKETIGTVVRMDKKYPKLPMIVLNLGFNNITDVGAKSLASAIVTFDHLGELDLRGNLISSVGLKYFVDSLMYNNSLKALDLSGNKFSDTDLRECLDMSTSLVADNFTRSTFKGKPMGGHDYRQTKKLDKEEILLSEMPVLSKRLNSLDSSFYYDREKRPSSAPPRVQTFQGKTSESILSRTSYHIPKREIKPRVTNQDMAYGNSYSRLAFYCPSSKANSILSRITVNSITHKEVNTLSKRVRPRPETAMISREGGRERAHLAKASIEAAFGNRKGNNGNNNKNPETMKKALSGKIDFKSGKVKNRLKREIFSGSVKPNSASVKPRKISPTFSKFNNRKFSEKPREGSYASSKHQKAFTFAQIGCFSELWAMLLDVTDSETVEENEQVETKKQKRLNQNILAPDMRQYNTGDTLLMKAVEGCHIDIVKMLLEDYDVDVNNVSNNGWTAMHFAVSSDHIQIIELLFQYNATLSAGVNEVDGTPLHLAVNRNSIKLVSTLFGLQNYLNANATNSAGETPVHLCAQTGNLQILRFLVSRGGDLHVKDQQGKTPLDIARQNQHYNLVDWIQSHNH